MSSKQLPASIRYLKARLRILQRPTVWVSASVLVVAIVFLAETWKHPQRFANPNIVPADGSDGTDATGANTLARPAPLDPLSSLEQDPFGTAQSPTAQSPASTDGLTGSSGGNRSLLPLLPPSQSPAARSTTSPSVPDPFASIRSSSSGGSSGGSSAGTTNPYSSSGSSSSSQNPYSASSPPSRTASGTNPLQSALDRNMAPTAAPQPSLAPTSPSSSFSSGTNSTAPTDSAASPTPAAPSVGQSSFVQPQPLPGQPSYGQTQPQPQFIPQTSPAPGTTGYTVPPAFRTNANTSAGPSFGNYNNAPPISNMPAAPAPSTGFSSTPQSRVSSPTAQPQVAQPQASPAPFSVPRTTPGRSIGGGQINTFSNP